MYPSLAIRTLTLKEVEALGHDAAEFDEHPLQEALKGHCRIWFEESPTTVWCVGITTEEAYLNTGQATRLLVDFIYHFRFKTIYWGCFTEEGDKYIKHVLVRLGAHLVDQRWAVQAVSRNAYPLVHQTT